MSLSCVVCGAQIHAGRLCQPCLTGHGTATTPPGVLRLLGDLAGHPYHGTGPKGASLGLLSEVRVALAKQARMSDSTGRSDPRRIPISLGALGDLYEATGTLMTWWRACAEATMPPERARMGQGATEQPEWHTDRGWGHKDARRAAVALIGASLWIASHDAADELVADVRRVHRRLLICVDRPAPRHYLGPCGSLDLDGKPCPGELWAGGESVRCRVCGAMHATDERRAWLDSLIWDEARNYLATDLAHYLRHPSTDRIRQWVSRGRLVPKGHDSQGRSLFNLGDALSLNVSKGRQGA